MTSAHWEDNALHAQFEENPGAHARDDCVHPRYLSRSFAEFWTGGDYREQAALVCVDCGADLSGLDLVPKRLVPEVT